MNDPQREALIGNFISQFQGFCVGQMLVRWFIDGGGNLDLMLKEWREMAQKHFQQVRKATFEASGVLPSMADTDLFENMLLEAETRIRNTMFGNIAKAEPKGKEKPS